MNGLQESKKIIALVPVFNEAFVIEVFLRLTLKFADHVIVADQGSTDGTRTIAEKFDSVTVLENRNALFDNAARSAMLIEFARERFGNQSILFAVDADELFCPSVEAIQEIEAIKGLAEGTTLLVDKPSFIDSTDRWIEYGSVFPLGYVDDGADYHGSLYHSRRVPRSTKELDYQCRSIKFVHLDALDMDAMLAKRRLYSIRERDAENSKLTVRWKRNAPLFLQSIRKKSCPVDPVVIECFSKNGVDFSFLRRNRPLWWDMEALRRFSRNGIVRYQWDDIWDYDWEQVLEDAQKVGKSDDLPATVRRPSNAVSLSRKLCLHGYYRVFIVWRCVCSLLSWLRNTARPHK